MTDAVKLSDLKYPNLQGDRSRRSETSRHAASGVAAASQPPCELDRIYRSLAEVTPENHPRTARLLASSNRKTAQKLIEEAGGVAIEAVKHRTRGIVRE